MCPIRHRNFKVSSVFSVNPLMFPVTLFFHLSGTRVREDPHGRRPGVAPLPKSASRRRTVPVGPLRRLARSR